MAGHLAGRVGEVDDLRRRSLVLAAEDAVAEPEVQGRADDDREVAGAERLAAGLGDQQRVTARDDAAAHAVGDRRDAELVDQPQGRLLGAVGPHVGAEHEHRPARPRRAGDRRPRARRGRARRRAARSTVGCARRSAVLKNSSIGTSTNTGPRWEEPATVNASCIPGATSAAVCSVRASFETGARIGGWSSSWSEPEPQRFAGARPPTTTIGEPANWAWAIALTPLVTPGPGGEHGEAGPAGELAGRLGRERRGLLVADVEEPHRRLGGDRAVVHREHVRPREGEHRLHAMGAGDRDGVLPGMRLDRLLLGVLRLRHAGEATSSGPSQWLGVTGKYAGLVLRSVSVSTSRRSERTAGWPAEAELSPSWRCRLRR